MQRLQAFMLPMRTTLGLEMLQVEVGQGLASRIFLKAIGMFKPPSTDKNWFRPFTRAFIKFDGNTAHSVGYYWLHGSCLLLRWWIPPLY